MQQVPYMIIQSVLLLLSPARQRRSVGKNSEVVAWTLFECGELRIDRIRALYTRACCLLMLSWLGHLGHPVSATGTISLR